MFFIIIFSVYVCYLENNYLEIKKTYNKQQIRIQGIIISNGNQKKYKTQYKIRVVKTYNFKTGEVKRKKFNLICDVKGNKEYIGLKFGDEITFNSSFEAPYTERNEGGFDYSSYLKTKKICGTVST